VNRALRAAAMGALLLSPVALSACSAGQVAQTATQERDKVGGTAMAGDLTIREARLAYPTNGEYAAGSDPRLIVAISNSGQEDDTLVDITGEGFASAELTGPAATAPATGGTAATGLDVPIPADSNVFIGGDGPAVVLSDLDEALTTGQGLDVTMSFEQAGDVRVRVLVGTPTRDLPRGEAFDFHEEEGGAEGGEAQLGGSSTE
jgi:copper(I)-binding protein